MKNKNYILKQKFEDLKVKLSEKKFDEVINECEEILKNNDNPVFFNLLCLAYMNKKQFEKAVNIMNQAINLNSKNPDFSENPYNTWNSIYSIYSTAQNKGRSTSRKCRFVIESSSSISSTSPENELTFVMWFPGWSSVMLVP